MKFIQYFGGKQRISKYIIEVLNEYRKANQSLAEPFVGGCNIISKMDGERYCSDINEYLIEMYKALQNGWIPPKIITKEQYDYIKNNKDEDKALTGFVGIGCCYSGKWFEGYAKNKEGRNYCLNAYNSLMRQLKSIKGIKFEWADYRELNYNGYLIYCDPPYKNMSKTHYFRGFDTEEFWETMREWSKNNTVIISGYEAPEDFECIKMIQTKTDIRNVEGCQEKRTERLFKYK